MAQHSNAALRKQIGARLRDLRIRVGISSQERLAHKAGVHRTYVGRLERGESGVTVEALAAILAPLGTSLGDFFAVSAKPGASALRDPRNKPRNSRADTGETDLSSSYFARRSQAWGQQRLASPADVI